MWRLDRETIDPWGVINFLWKSKNALFVSTSFFAPFVGLEYPWLGTDYGEISSSVVEKIGDKVKIKFSFSLSAGFGQGQNNLNIFDAFVIL